MAVSHSQSCNYGVIEVGLCRGIQEWLLDLVNCVHFLLDAADLCIYILPVTQFDWFGRSGFGQASGFCRRVVTSVVLYLGFPSVALLVGGGGGVGILAPFIVACVFGRYEGWGIIFFFLFLIVVFVCFLLIRFLLFIYIYMLLFMFVLIEVVLTYPLWLTMTSILFQRCQRSALLLLLLLICSILAICIYIFMCSCVVVRVFLVGVVV